MDEKETRTYQSSLMMNIRLDWFKSFFSRKIVFTEESYCDHEVNCCVSTGEYFTYKVSITNSVLQNLPQNRDNFLNQKDIYIHLDPIYAILCDQINKLSVMSNVHITILLIIDSKE